jgi:hypothetical protein
VFHNKASRESGQALVRELGVRNQVTELRHNDGRIAAIVEWRVFGNPCSTILNTLLAEHSILNRKGGFDLATLDNTGRLLANVLRRRSGTLLAKRDAAFP